MARDAARLNALAARLRAETGRAVDILAADLAARPDLLRVEHRLRQDPSIGMLVNNAGVAVSGPMHGSDVDRLEVMVNINITAALRLAHAAVEGFVAPGRGTLITRRLIPKDTKKANELNQQMAELAAKLGPEYIALVGGLQLWTRIPRTARRSIRRSTRSTSCVRSNNGLAQQGAGAEKAVGRSARRTEPSPPHTRARDRPLRSRQWKNVYLA